MTVPLRTTTAGSTLPGLLFVSFADPAPTRRPEPRRAFVENASTPAIHRCVLAKTAIQPFLAPSLPFRLVSEPFRSTQPRDSVPVACRSELARYPFAPRRLCDLTHYRQIIVPGSLLPVWLCCSLQPLGTKFRMHLNRIRVNKKELISSFSAHLYFLCLQALAVSDRRKSCQ